ncbi:MAG TPA: 2-succinyl-5-enolpyruvyl-6-hydroxy-3-cyclohexene-1-carboxylic-acid synthase [Acidimicrobiales bacterium]|nr:2-succinyl-5-enolpyruvyl-6-hydroxy-3-cyclohexene-1-carboxylic-acid synthase [Acidimicrobiales bacterium]
MSSTPPVESPAPAAVQATFAATLVDEWLRCGVRHAVVCPGSRSTPLALALSGRPEIALHVHHDERSGGFLALGLGLATRQPAVVLTTSGTAAAELHPAVLEADLAGVPFLACTADRPPELRDVGAPQAIDQVHLFGRAVRWFGDPGVPDMASASRWRAFAGRAYAATRGARPGPVHLNLPFREPLVGRAGALPPGRGDRPWVARTSAAATAEAPVDVPVELRRLAGRRGVIVAGAAPIDGPALHRLAEALGWPVLTEPRSPAWIPAATGIVHLDAILRSPRAADGLRPEAILRVGAPGASRVVNEWLAASGADEVVVGAPGWSDPAATAATVIDGPPAAVLAAFGSVVSGATPGAWLERWVAASDAAAMAVASALAQEPTPNEPAIAREVVAALPDGARLVVASSMPIRDVERYAAPRNGVAVLANRGANGIDGTVSTALGVAVGSAAPTALLIGDIAFLHDSNGLLGAAGRGIDLVCVVVDNDGGGIFSFLPQARALPAERFETLFGTPHGLDLVALAAAYGIDARALERDDATGAAVGEAAAKGGVHVLVARTDRAANIEVHGRVDGAVAAAVDAALS